MVLKQKQQKKKKTVSISLLYLWQSTPKSPLKQDSFSISGPKHKGVKIFVYQQ